MPRSHVYPVVLGLIAGAAVLPPVAAQPAAPRHPRLVLPRAATAEVPPDSPATDAQALKQAGLDPADGAKLIEYLKQRTVSDTDRGKILEIIKKFTADSFDERLKAGEELEQFGPAAIGLLKAAEKDADPEVAYRATLVLKRVEKVPHAVALAATVRAVARLKPPGAAAALLDYLPLADTDALAEEIRGALVTLAGENGKPDPALVAALRDPSPVRRTAAYVALTEGGPAGERVRFKESYAQLKDAVRADADAGARFRGLWALALTTREKEFVPDLIGMIPQLPRGRIWQLEEFLLGLAGQHPDGGRFGKSAESLTRARDAWAGWWAKKGAAVDLVAFDFKPRVLGFTDLVESNPQNGMGQVVSLGPDLNEAWRLGGNNFYPSDARVLPNGRILTVEQNYSRVTERSTAGTILATRNGLNQPVAAEPLPNGGMLVVGRMMVYEFDKAGVQKWSFARPMADIIAGRRLPNGDTIFLTYAQQGGANCFRLDAKGKDTGKGVALGRLNPGYCCMDVTGPDKILVCEPNRVVEYDLKSGKAGWSYAINQPTSVQRLPNGNTLIAAINSNRAIEVDPAGEVVWEYAAKDGMRIVRAYRR